MEAHSISPAVGNILEDFISDVNYCSQTITVKYFAEKRPYGSKVVISGKNRNTNKTIFYFLVKVRSSSELECLKHYQRNPIMFGGILQIANSNWQWLVGFVPKRPSLRQTLDRICKIWDQFWVRSHKCLTVNIPKDLCILWSTHLVTTVIVHYCPVITWKLLMTMII